MKHTCFGVWHEVFRTERIHISQGVRINALGAYNYR